MSNQTTMDSLTNNVIAKNMLKDLLDENVRIKNNAINLLKEIRLISGINARKYETPLFMVIEFNQISKMIDEFKDKYELKGFKN